MKTNYLSHLAIIAGMFVVFACASNERYVDDVAVNAAPTDNPSDQIASLEKKIGDAREQNVHVLSPTWFNSAEKSLKRAKEARDDGKDLKEIFRHTAQGEAQIRRASDFASVAQRNMTDILSARQDAWRAYDSARMAGATDLIDLRDDLRDEDDEFFELTRAVEDNNLKAVENNRLEVINEYRKLQGRSLVKEKLDTSKRLVKRAKDEGADNFAPRSLAYAEDVITNAEKLIMTNQGTPQEIDEKRKEAEFYAQRALEMTKTAKWIDDKDPEEVALWTEEHVAGLGRELGLADMRNLQLEQQFADLKGSVHQYRGAREGLATLSTDTKRMRNELKMTREQTEKIQAITAKFSRDEAEVLVQDNKLILRLRGVKFPPGESTLSARNFPLLGKVSDTLEEYPGAQIIVEGHTDSTGSKELNARLSQQRAEAVRNYLVSANAVPRQSVVAVGFGFEKPVAANKTPAGRAANRRIDVVISSPETPHRAD